MIVTTGNDVAGHPIIQYLARIFHSLKKRRTYNTKKAQCFQGYWTQNSGSRKTAPLNTLSKTKTPTCAVLLLARMA